jgi:ABC-type bacteriocin/lantibiotic exporter with double-glycine peptidase domain
MIIILRKFYSILESKQKKFIFLLIVLLSVIGAALEMLSIGLIVPIVSSLNNQYISNNYLNYIFSFVAISEDKIILLLLILLILIFIFKTVFFTFFSFINAKFSADLNSNISSRIFNNYIYQDYSFFLKRGSSSLIQNINIEISNFINIFFASLLVFLNEIITLFGISIILIYISPISFFIFVFIIGFFSIFFVNSVSKLLKKWGHQRQLYQLTSLRQLQEGIRNIKDLKIYNLENKFYKYFSSQIRLYSNVEKYVNFLSVIPRYYIELIGVLFFVLVINVFILLSYSNEKIIIILSVFSLSALKILPSVNRIINSIIKLKYSHVSLEAIYRDINLRVPNSKNLSYKKKLIILNKKLILKKVSYYYENRNKFILKNVNIKINLGKTIGIIGDSGSGKTTLVDLILGILKPTTGKILCNSIDLKINLRSWQSRIGYVQQNSYLIEDTIAKNITFGEKNINLSPDIKRVNYCLNLVGLKNFINKLPKKIDTPVNELGRNFSGGQKQRICIARALYLEPEILILDEATNSLDETSEINLIKNISLFSRKEKKTIIIITHKKNLWKYCDETFEVKNGNVQKRNFTKY